MEPGRATFCAAEGGVGGLSWKTVEKLKEMRNFYLNVAWGFPFKSHHLHKTIKMAKTVVTPAT